MRALKHRFKHRALVQKIATTVIADICMLAVGIVFAYYFTVLFL